MFDNRVIVLGPVEYTFCGETYFTGFQALTLIICGDSPAFRPTIHPHSQPVKTLKSCRPKDRPTELTCE